MRNKIILILVTLGLGLMTHAQLVVPRMVAPIIDGLTDGDDWGDSWTEISLANPSNSTTGMSSKFQIGHDDDNIYLIVQTQDATPNNDATVLLNTWERDCIEVFFSMHSVTDDNTYTDGDWQIRCQRDGEILVDGTGTTADEFIAGNFVVEVNHDNANQYTIEWSFSKVTLAGISDFDGENLRFDIQAADNTTGSYGGRTQQQFWNSNTDAQWANTSYFGAIVLGKINLNTTTISFPDANFKKYLVENTAININGDNEIQISEASTFSGSINVSGSDIFYLNGIEAFSALTGLVCNNNSIRSLDLKSNIKLTELNCSNNIIKSLDLTSNNALTLLNCSNNNLNNLDIKNGNNTHLVNFNAAGNPYLFCVSVDDVDYSTINWTNIDAQTNFNTECAVAKVLVPFASAPIIDGVFDNNDSWGDTWISQDMESISATTHNMSSKFQITHDNENIYIVATILDSTPNNDASIVNTYDRDCLETFFSFKSSNFQQVSYTVGDYQIRCQRASENNTFIDGTTSVIDFVTSGDIKYGVVSNTKGWVIEMAYNIDALAANSDFDGGNFRFEIQTADNTTGLSGGRTQQRFWNSNTDAQWNNTSYFGAMALSGISESTYPVSFTVTDENLRPVSGASIELTGYGIQLTDSTGKVSFAKVLPDVNIEYTVTKTDFKNITSSLSIFDTAVTENIVMHVKTYPVTFTVLNENSIPMDSVMVELTGYGTQLTNSKGKVKFAEVLPAGNIAYSLSKHGFRDTTGTISVMKAAFYKNIVMHLKTYPVTFTLTDENSVSIIGATIELTGYSTQITDSNGTATFLNVLPADKIIYSIAKNGFKNVIDTISVIDTAVFETIVMHLKTYLVSFNITDENLFPIEGATIELTGYETQVTDSKGAVIFPEVLPADDIAYSVTKTGFNDKEGTISVVEAAIYENIVISQITSILTDNAGDVTSLLLYPNPVTKEFSISSTQNVESLVILNLHGQVVYKFNEKLMRNEKYQIDVSELPGGIYLVKADAKIERILIE